MSKITHKTKVNLVFGALESKSFRLLKPMWDIHLFYFKINPTVFRPFLGKPKDESCIKMTRLERGTFWYMI